METNRDGRPFERGKHGTPNQDRDYDADELEFLKAMDRYKRVNNRPFPTWSEVLGVLKGLGWRKR